MSAIARDVATTVDMKSGVAEIYAEHATTSKEAAVPVAQLKRQFIVALRQYEKEAQQAGNIDGVIAARNLATSVEVNKPPEKSPADAGVQELHKAYLEKFRVLDDDEKRTLLDADRRRYEAMKKLAEALAKAGKVEDAIKVRNDSLTEESKRRILFRSNPLNPSRSGTELWARETTFKTPDKFEKSAAAAFAIGRGRNFLELKFGSERIALGRAKKAHFVFRVSTNPYANTPALIEVTCDGKRIGSILGAKRGAVVRIPLDLKALQDAKNFKLTVTVHGEFLEITVNDGIPDAIILLE